MSHMGKYTERYVGDANPLRPKRLHDLDNEKESCTLTATEWRGNEVPFATREAAYAAGYKPCIFCMPHEKGAI
jgi:hypothetical protein